MIDDLIKIDEQILLALNDLRAPFWDYFMWTVSSKLTWAPMYAVILYVLFHNFNWKLAFFTISAILLTILYADQVSASAIRPWIERLRPSNPNNPISEYVDILNNYRGGRYGFPSCHAANSFALAFFITFLFRNKWTSIFLLFWASLNSYSRIYLGVHYPGDLLVGMFIGLTGSILIYLLYRALLKNKKIAGTILQANQRKDFAIPIVEVKHINSITYMGLATLAVIIIYSAISTI